MKKTFFVVVVILLLIAFGVSAFLVGSYLLEGKEQEDRYNELSNIAAENRETTQATTQSAQTGETTAPQETENAAPTEPTMIPGYAEIYEMNNDTVGWLRIEGTKLDYPVLQTPDDPNFYLYRDFDKKDSTHGSVYAWAAADINEPSDNITLFGHNMADGSMFACLHSMTTKAAWEKNSLIFFDTLSEYHTYKIFAVFTTSANLDDPDYFAYHQFVDADSEAEFDKFVSTCKDKALFDTGITPVYGDKLICLSTCEYTHDNGRLVVAAVRIT